MAKVKVTLSELPGWEFTIDRSSIFRYIEAKAPNGYVARVGSHEFNPNNVMCMLIDDLITNLSRNTDKAT